MVMPARVICCPEVPLDKRKRGAHHRPSSIALVSPTAGACPRAIRFAFPRHPKRTALAAVGTWVMYIYMNNPNATKPPESLPRMWQGPEGLAHCNSS